MDDLTGCRASTVTDAATNLAAVTKPTYPTHVSGTLAEETRGKGEIMDKKRRGGNDRKLNPRKGNHQDSNVSVAYRTRGKKPHSTPLVSPWLPAAAVSR